jgi:hypothetical protein
MQDSAVVDLIYLPQNKKAPTSDKEWLRLCGIMDGRSVPCEVLENRARWYGDALACRERRGINSTSAISWIHIWRLKGYGNSGRHEPVGLVRRAEYAMSKAATSALGVGDLERLNCAAQSGYASGSLVVAANRGGASTTRSGGSYAASAPITINAPIYLIQHMRRGYNIAKASDRQELGLK